MSLEIPGTPRDQREAQLTALLFGELSPQDTAEVRRALESDPELAGLHARLEAAIGLVREATLSAPGEVSAPSPPPKLPDARREQLLQVFRTVTSTELAARRRREMPWFIPMSIAAMLVVLIGAAALLPEVRERAGSAALASLAPQGQRTETLLAESAGGAVTLSGSSAFKSENQPADVERTRERFGLAGDPEERRVVTKVAKPAERVNRGYPVGREAGSSEIAGARLGGGVRGDGYGDFGDFKGADGGQNQTASPLKSFFGEDFDVRGEGAATVGQAHSLHSTEPSILAKDKVPVLGDIASIGRFFRSSKMINNDGGPLPAATPSGVLDVAQDYDRLAMPGVEVQTGFPVQRLAETLRGVESQIVLPVNPNPGDGRLLAQPDNAPSLSFSAAPPARAPERIAPAAAGHSSSITTPELRSRSGLSLPEGEVAITELARPDSAARESSTRQTDHLSRYKAKAPSPTPDWWSEVEVRQLGIQPIDSAGVERPGIYYDSSSPMTTHNGVVQRGDQENSGSIQIQKAGLIPQPEVQTADNAFSTFSLNVSDVSFKLAAASLEKGVMPQLATVRSEEFINAFDYHDPEPPPGAPLALAWERARYPFAHDRDLVRFSIKTAAQGRQPGHPLNLVLLLDNSGSMERADRVQIVREALRVLAGQLQPQDKLSMITFARTARLWVDGVVGNQAGAAFEQLAGLTPEGGTNLEAALQLAYQTALKHFIPSGGNRVVLLTDGAANLGTVNPDALKTAVEIHRKQGVALDCFGIGWEGLNDDLLETLSRNGDGRYGFLNAPEDAAGTFAAQLAGALRVAASDVKVQVQFNSNRVQVYRQIGYAKHQLTQEQFRDNSVDAAEIGAAESGTALYVVQVNPRGEGDLGVVRVRYKTPGTVEYHEHEWSIPYTGSAPNLEQASPALRLAATASGFSEWLISSPYAAEITPGQLLAYVSDVTEVYGADPRPKQLEWMIRQAKSVTGK